MLCRRNGIVAGLALALTAGAGGCSSSKHGVHLVGQRAPDFTLTDLTGAEVSLTDFRGKVVLLTFWAYG